MQECPEKLKPHLNHNLELDHKIEGGHVSIKVYCCECGEDVEVLYEGSDVSERLWEVRLKVKDMWLRNLPVDARPGSSVNIVLRCGEEALDTEADIISIEEQSGKNFVCAGCGNITSASRGSADDLPYHCDDCWAKEHPEIEDEFLEALNDKEEWAINLLGEVASKYARKR